MKTIIAILKIDTMNETKKALSDAGVPSFTATGRVFGRGKGKWEMGSKCVFRRHQTFSLELQSKQNRMGANHFEEHNNYH